MSSAAILPASLALPRPTSRSLSSVRVLTGSDQFYPSRLISLSLSIEPAGFPSVPAIRMGGGPRTYPGGVSKWQWKRMQAKKAKQLLKARLCRERQIYEMRKRAELKAAVSELERPWEVVERAPALFSVSADEQVKTLADRFQRPGGFDMWSERDGPQIFRSPDGLPSARFFPKGVVHSLKPYGIIAGSEDTGGSGDGKEMRFDDWIARGGGGIRRSRRPRRLPNNRESRDESDCIDVEASDSVGRSVQDGENARLDSYERRDARASSNGRNRGNRKPAFDSASDFVAIREEGNGKNVGRGSYNSRNRRFKAEKISLRPTTDLYSAEGRNRTTRESKWREGNGFRRNHARSP